MNLLTILILSLIFVVLPALSLLPPEIIKHPAREVSLVTSLPAGDQFRPFYRRSEYINKSFTLECEAVGDPTPEYRWSKNGISFSYNHTILNPNAMLNGRVYQVTSKGTLVFSNPHEDDAGTYQCFAENKRGTASSDTASVLIVWSDDVKEKHYDQYLVIKGLPLKIPCKIPNGWPKWEVYWLKDFKPIEDDRIKEDPEGNLLFAYTEMKDSTPNGYYRCVGKTVYMSTPLVSVRLVVERDLSILSGMTPLVAQYVSPKIKVAISGQPAALYCIYSGNPMPFVKWSKNSTAISKFDKITKYDDTNMSTLRIPQVKLSDQSNYTCNVTSIKSDIEMYSNTTTLIVYEAPLFEETPHNMNISKGETATINCTATGVPEPKVTWYKNGDMIWSNEFIKRSRNYYEDQRLRINEFSLIIDEVMDKDTGNYACNVSNTVGYIFKDVYINVTKAKPKSKIVPIVTTLVIAVLLLTVCVSDFRIVKKRKRNEAMVRLAQETSICLNATPTSTSDPWQFNRARLMLLDVIGEGNFGKVFLAEAVFEAETGGETKHNVAVKTTHVNTPDCARLNLLHELEILKSIQQHLNVVKLIGACTETSPTFLIMELLSESLHQFLRKARTKKYYELPVGDPLGVTSQLLMSFALQTAKGMHHISSQGIIHRDLATRNVLLSSDLVCKVADFGLARKVNSEEIYARQSNTPLPIRWMAPESLISNETSVKSDVWSFGVLLWELTTLGATPYPGKGGDEIRHMICEGECMEKPKTCEIELHNVMMQCWNQEPQQRPDFGVCSDLLASLLETNADYIQLDDFPDQEYLVVENAVGETV